MKQRLKKALSIVLVIVMVICSSYAAITAFASSGSTASLGASKACDGHVLGEFNSSPACVNENGDLHICKENFPDKYFLNYIKNANEDYALSLIHI